MTLSLELTPDEEARIRRRAATLGIDEREYAHRLLQAGLQDEESYELRDEDRPKTGAELVAYWEREGLIGTRPDITDSQAHAREIRSCRFALGE